MFRQLRNERGNWTLIGLLVACAAVLVIFSVLYLGKAGPGQRAADEGLVKPKEGQTVLGASLDKGKETACMSNLRQIRMIIESTKATGEPLPATIQDMKLGSAGMCPVSKQPYQYDSATATVRCATPGHERL